MKTITIYFDGARVDAAILERAKKTGWHNGCQTKSGELQPFQDKTAAEVVRFWAYLQTQQAGGSALAVDMAHRHANLMDAWPKHKVADV